MCLTLCLFLQILLCGLADRQAVVVEVLVAYQERYSALPALVDSLCWTENGCLLLLWGQSGIAYKTSLPRQCCGYDQVPFAFTYSLSNP
jgi:hypothetical protein